ncbi:IS110 family transposase [Rhodococcus sp. D-46]|nr:IS110 family transposase [Rhodococcus sp. D-46]
MDELLHSSHAISLPSGDARGSLRHRPVRQCRPGAVYAGVAPRPHRSWTSIKGEYHRHGGNSRLKRAMYLSAFASLRDPQSRMYHDRKRTEGKNHRSALICFARR